MPQTARMAEMTITEEPAFMKPCFRNLFMQNRHSVYIWNSRESSPQEFLVTQDGVHKYYVEYEQGEAVKEAPDPEDAQRARLELWVKKAWEAECAVMGRNPEENRNPAVVVGNAAENDKRLRNLISAEMIEVDLL